MSKASEVVAIATAEIGYKEKASNANLDEKTANAGSANWTKYARDLADAGYYNGNKNGYAWCDVFVDWCFFKAFGKDKGQEIQCQTGPLGAGCTYSAQYYKEQGRYDKTPQVGDQVFFQANGEIGHTGIVVKVSETKITTVEGNSGDQVNQNTYTRASNYIAGYGHPKYDENDGGVIASTTQTTDSVSAATDTPEEKTEAAEKTVTVQLTQLSKGSEGPSVKTLQRIIRVRGINNRIDIDGEFGPITKAGVIALQKVLFPNEESEWDGVVGERTWTATLTKLN